MKKLKIKINIFIVFFVFSILSGGCISTKESKKLNINIPTFDYEQTEHIFKDPPTNYSGSLKNIK